MTDKTEQTAFSRLLSTVQLLYRSTVLRSTAWYLRFLGAIYLIAFVSLWTQIDGLIGSQGILPVKQYLADIQTQLPHSAWWQVPTLCWINSSDTFLTIQCALGTVISLLAIAGIAQPIAFAILWLLYLSLVSASQQFLGYQWDCLLLEAGLLAIFFSPLQWLAWKPTWAHPPTIILWLQRWLIFRLMFLSGLVKLASGDPAWRNLSALTYHYWTQPLPTWTSWYAAHWPLGFQKFSATFMFIVELGMPLLMFGPRKLRTIAAAGVIGLQLLILATGNYGFFNLLAIALCIPLLDDNLLPAPRPRPATETPTPRNWSPWVLKPLAAIILVATSLQFIRQCGYRQSWPAPLEVFEETLAPLRSLNSYGLFAVMTTDRPVLIVEGSDEGGPWKEYGFKYQSGDVSRPPQFCSPHMPRLDWQMWFAALDPQSNSNVLEGLLRGILHNSKPVLSLMGQDPFHGHAPKYVRLKMYKYEFTTASERAQTGNWWTRTDTGLTSGAYSLGGAEPGEPHD
jgi:hypothetical protein